MEYQQSGGADRLPEHGRKRARLGPQHALLQTTRAQVVEELVSSIGVVEKLTGFQHKGANGRDWGLNMLSYRLLVRRWWRSW